MCVNGVAAGYSPSCSCDCTNTGFEGNACETASACVVGAASTTGTIKCLNGGVAAGTSPFCSCNCADGFEGDTCEISPHRYWRLQTIDQTWENYR